MDRHGLVELGELRFQGTLLVQAARIRASQSAAAMHHLLHVHANCCTWKESLSFKQTKDSGKVIQANGKATQSVVPAKMQRLVNTEEVLPAQGS